jgi:hypothetical protein
VDRRRDNGFTLDGWDSETFTGPCIPELWSSHDLCVGIGTKLVYLVTAPILVNMDHNGVGSRAQWSRIIADDYGIGLRA